MKDEPKWQDTKSRAFGDEATGDGFGEDPINLDDDISAPTASADNRPMGRDRAKARKKKANSDAASASSSEYASMMQEMSLQRISIMQAENTSKSERFQLLSNRDEKRYEEMRSHNQALLAIEQEKVQMQREKHDKEIKEKENQDDERILAIDLNCCTPAQRIYYEARQEEIFEKIAARRRNRAGPAP